MRPYRAHDHEAVSALMSRIRAKDNRAEVALRKALWQRGLRYRLYSRRLPGRPDLVFSPARVVVFVDGDFWHGRVLVRRGLRALRATFRGRRRDWWVAKISRNVERDVLVTAALRREGWQVVRVWEKDVLRDVEAAVRRVAHAVRRRSRRA